MRYCVYCGTPHEDNEVCGCEEARAERRRKAERKEGGSHAQNPFRDLLGLYSMFDDDSSDNGDGSDNDNSADTDAAADVADAFGALFGGAFASAFGGNTTSGRNTANERDTARNRSKADGADLGDLFGFNSADFGADPREDAGNGEPEGNSSAEPDGTENDGAETIDVFKHIDLYYIGKSGCADAHVRYLTRGGIISCCKFGVEPSSELANGDKVTVTLLNAEELEARFDVKFEKREYVFTVGYLEEARRLDAFSEIHVVFSGMSGEGTVALVAKDEDTYAFCCDFSVEPSQGLSNGDKVTVSITNRAQLIHAFGIVPKDLEREYIVNTLTEHVSSPADLDLRAVKELGRRFFETESEYPTSSFNDYRYEGAYLFVKRDPKAELRFGNSRLEIMVSFRHMNGTKVLGRSYSILGLNELTHLPGQTAELDLSTAENDRIVGDLDRYLREQEMDYRVYKID